MNTQLLTVNRSGGEKRPRPRISFFGDWLYEIGFAPGALVQVLPAPGGVDFHLCDENINSYSDLFHSTRDKGGNLIRAYLSNTHKCKGPAFVTSGKYIYSGGLSMGDILVAQYDYGIIRARKIDPAKLGFKNLRIITVSYITRKYTKEIIPKVLICGDWLNDIGFKIDTLMTVSSAPGIMTLDLQEIVEYRALMKYVREHKLKIAQVYKEPKDREEPRPCIGITGACVDKAGFKPGDILAASYGNGIIKLQTLDFDKLGF